MEVVDDVKQITILVESVGDIIISNLQYPQNIGLGEPFDISYDCVSRLPTPREIWGVIINRDIEIPVAWTYWVETFTGIKSISNHFEGTYADLYLSVRVGGVW